jgi:acyl carrier protein
MRRSGEDSISPDAMQIEIHLGQLVGTILGRPKLEWREWERRDLAAAGLDSMKLIDLMLGIESRWGIKLDPEDLSHDNFCNLGRIASLIRVRSSSSAGDDK